VLRIAPGLFVAERDDLVVPERSLAVLERAASGAS